MKNTSTCNVLVGKSQRMRLHGAPECRCEDTIQMDPKKWKVKVGTGFSWLGIGSIGGFF
jgi:hypothetical protein